MGVNDIDGWAQKHLPVFLFRACERSAGLHSASSKWQCIDQKVRPDWTTILFTESLHVLTPTAVNYASGS